MEGDPTGRVPMSVVQMSPSAKEGTRSGYSYVLVGSKWFSFTC